MISRRALVSTIAGGVLALAFIAPLASDAQQRAKLPTIGFLGATTASAVNQWTAAFQLRLRELGWIQSRTITIEYRWAEGRNERFAAIAAEFVRSKVDVIVTHSAAPVLAAKQATTVIPIVFAAAADPVGSGLVANLARPGGNVTGLSSQATDLAAKRVGLLREIVPSISGVATMANFGNPACSVEMGDIQAAARTLGLKVVALDIQRAADIAPAVAALSGRTEALYVCSDAFLMANRFRIAASALRARLLTSDPSREFVEAGGLMSYGPNSPDLFRRAADYVDKILKGAKPGDLPIEQPTKFDLVISMKTAKALGLTIPPSLLLRADQIIE